MFLYRLQSWVLHSILHTEVSPRGRTLTPTHTRNSHVLEEKVGTALSGIFGRSASHSKHMVQIHSPQGSMPIAIG